MSRTFRQIAVTGAAALVLTAAGQALAQPAMMPPVAYKPPPPYADILAKAQAGDADFEAALAYDYAMGTPDTPRDKRTAMDWYAKAAAQGNATAIENLKLLQDNYTRYQKLKADAETGNANAEYAFADFTRTDEIGMLDGNGYEPSQAISWFHRAADQGQPDAEAYLGLYYLRAWAYATYPYPKAFNYKSSQAPASPDNFATALLWYNRAGLQGQPAALHALPVLYALDTPFHDFSRTEDWLQKAAYAPEPAFPGAVPPDSPAFTRWQANTGAMEDALMSLWMMYRGLGFRRSVTEYDNFVTADVPTNADDRKLFICLTHWQATAYNPYGYELGEMYEYGQGTPVNEAAAIRIYLALFKDSNRRGDYVERAKAQMGLISYGHGDLAKAYFWLSQSYDFRKPEPDFFLEFGVPEARHLFPHAKAVMAQLMTRLPAAERARQDAAVKAWQATLPMVMIMPPTP